MSSQFYRQNSTQITYPRTITFGGPATKDGSKKLIKSKERIQALRRRIEELKKKKQQKIGIKSKNKSPKSKKPKSKTQPTGMKLRSGRKI